MERGAGGVEGHFVMCYEECLGLSLVGLLCPHSLATSGKSLLAKTLNFQCEMESGQDNAFQLSHFE